jgi:hypothetical protein
MIVLKLNDGLGCQAYPALGLNRGLGDQSETGGGRCRLIASSAPKHQRTEGERA